MRGLISASTQRHWGHLTGSSVFARAMQTPPSLTAPMPASNLDHLGEARPSPSVRLPRAPPHVCCASLDGQNAWRRLEFLPFVCCAHTACECASPLSSAAGRACEGLAAVPPPPPPACLQNPPAQCVWDSQSGTPCLLPAGFRHEQHHPATPPRQLAAEQARQLQQQQQLGQQAPCGRPCRGPPAASRPAGRLGL